MGTKTKLLKKFLLSSAALVVGTVGAAELAQAQLDEIVVTATKREKSLQDVPISVSAFSGATLQQAGVTNIESLQFSVAGLAINTATTSGFSTSVRLRGVGTSSTNIGFEGAVGIFLDGVYRPRAGTALGDMPDVERVEVLRGPQGTLFGRNTTAGAISIVTKKPVLDEFDASLRATFGNFDRTQVQGIVNVPLVDGKLAARLGADYHVRDGYLTNIHPDSDDTNDRDRVNIRAQLLWEPTPDMELRIIGNYFKAHESCCGAVQTADGALSSVGNLGAFAALGITPPLTAGSSRRDEFVTTRNRPTTEDIEEYGIQADFEWDLPWGITFFNSLSYLDYELDTLFDSDHTGFDFILGDITIQQEQFTEEFRFTGSLDELPLVQSVNWLFGGYYSSENLGQTNDFNVGDDGAPLFDAVLMGAAAPFALRAGDSQFSVLGQNAKARALFAHLDIDLIDWLNLSGGVRFTSEDKVGGGVFTTVNVGPTLNPFILPGAKPFVDNADEDRWIGTVALTVEFTEELSVYTSFAHGYKSGGINLDVLGGQAGAFAGTPRAGFGPETFLDPTFEEETSNTYEVGFKGRFLEDRVSLNLTGFHAVFRNFQLLNFTGTSFESVSAPEVTTTGVESELQINPIEGLNFGVQYTYADAEYSAPFLLGANQLGDSRINSAPLHSAAVTASYRAAIPNTRLVGSLFGGWTYNSNSNTVTSLPASGVQNGYSLFTGRLGIHTDDDKYGLELWCRNCGDEFVKAVSFASPVFVDAGAQFSNPHPPREWGVTLSARY